MKALILALMCILLLGRSLRAEEAPDYLRDVKPILARNCYACHGAHKQRSGLRLDTAANVLRGGNSGPAIVAGQSAQSRLIRAVAGTDDVKLMPPKEPRLTGQEVALLKAWIEAGAKAPADEVAEKRDGKEATHWAFRSPVRPPEPAVRDMGWVRNPIDRFILERLEKVGISPAPEADRLTLLRRLSLDLLGLPPSIREIDEFRADTRADAYEHLVERLLKSPHYGERWGRHWLDLARYADSNGFNIDAPRTIWKYRDWVIDAFNHDLPFDQFTIEQIAGDLLPNAAVEQKIATGFHRNTLINQEGGIDLEQFRVESVVDRVNTTGAVFLGLTLGCAQCHDHKYDPISQRDYYQLFAFYNSTEEPNLELGSPALLQQRKQIRSQIAAADKKLKGLDVTTPAMQLAWEKKLTPEAKSKLPQKIQAILKFPDNGRSRRQEETLTAYYRQLNTIRHVVGGIADTRGYLLSAHLKAAQERLSLERRIARLKKADPEIVTTMVMRERATPRMTTIHLGGDFLRKGARVVPDTPAMLHSLRADGPADSRLTRLDLARWLVDARNPLTARVTMNRFWQHYFGTGLVETENDFGTQGTPPSHPELLDWLATEFIAQGWSMKAMHRLIVTSAAYRQSSHSRPELATLDPRNRLLARQTRLRLEAEVVRDIALAASGLLARKIGGPSVFPLQPDGVYRFTQIERNWQPSPGPERYRRGMYTHFWRSAPHPALTVFDAPDSTTTCTRRNRSNTPLQALTLLNDQGFYEFAQALAGRVLAEAGTSDLQRIHHIYQLCLARTPSVFEEQCLARLLAETDGESPLTAWTTVARVLLNLDEFITRE